MNDQLKQTLYYAASLVILKGASLLFLPVVTRFLAPSDYGVLDVVLAFANISTIVLGFGLVSAMFRFVGLESDTSQQKRICSELLGLAIVIAVIFGGSLQIAANSLLNLFPEGVTEIHLRLVIVTLSLEGLIGLPFAFLRYRNLAKQFFIVSVTKELSQLLLMYGLLSSGYGVTGMLFAGAVCASCLALYLVGWQAYDSGIRFNLSTVRPYLGYGGPVVVSGLAGFALVGLDRWVIANTLGTETLGAYAIALKFSVVATFLLQPYGMWWFPRRFKVFKEQSRERTAYFSAIGVSISLLSIAFVSVAAPVFIRFALPESYHGAINILPGLLLLSFLKSACDFMSFGCFYRKLPWVQTVIQVISSIIAVLGFYFLVPIYGLDGVLVTLLFAQCLRFTCLFFASQRIVWLPYPKKALMCLTGVTLSTVYLSTLHGESWQGVLLLCLLLAFSLIVAVGMRLIPVRLA